MDMLELKFRRVCEAMIRTPASMLKNGSGGDDSCSSPAAARRPAGSRPCVTWADDPGGSNFTASPRLLQRLQGCQSSPRSSPAGNRRRQRPQPEQLDNYKPSTPSRCRRFFFGQSSSSPSPAPLNGASSATSSSNCREVSPGAGTNLRRIFLDNCRPPNLDNYRPNHAQSGSQLTPMASNFRDVEKNTKMPVLFSRPLSINRNTEVETFFDKSDFVTESVQWHNLIRQRHNAQPLTLTAELCQSAQEWANFLAHNDTFYHRNPQDVGENLFHRFSILPDFDITGKEAVDYWYSGIRQYNFNAEPDLLHLNAGHFSQLVWRNSSEIGVGKARARGGKFIVVTHYRPQGNIIGQFKENVLPPMMSNDNDDAASTSDASAQELSSPEACSSASST